MKVVTRRSMLTGSVAAASLAATSRILSTRAQDTESESLSLAWTIGETATAFLVGLSDAELQTANYAFDDPNRTFWHWTATTSVPRQGLRFGDMSESQQTAALTLLRSSVSKAGYEKSLNIMALQSELGRDPEEFYVTLFGNPAEDNLWGWRFEGHHLSLHLTIEGDQVTPYPFFLGAWPTEASTGLRTMDREEAAARELITALDSERKSAAIFEPDALGTHITQNAVSVEPLDSVGISASEFTTRQRELLDEILATYLGILPENLATQARDEISAAGLATIMFAWSGSLLPLERHYYRIQAPTFLLEFDNSRNGAPHIHSVWRDFGRDFGGHR
ncbi:DUF3500 domain-containing protein [soil metagenome]